jgi:hypothetical protein
VKIWKKPKLNSEKILENWVSSIFCYIFSLFNLPFCHIFHVFSLFNLLFFCIFQIFSLFNYDRKVSWIVKRYNKIWKKPKLNSEKIWKIQKKIVKRYGKCGRKVGRNVKEKHIISQFNLLFFRIFHIFSLFNLLFFHIFHIISQFSSVFSKIFSLFNLGFFNIFTMFLLFSSVFS